MPRSNEIYTRGFEHNIDVIEAPAAVSEPIDLEVLLSPDPTTDKLLDKDIPTGEAGSGRTLRQALMEMGVALKSLKSNERFAAPRVIVERHGKLIVSLLKQELTVSQVLDLLDAALKNTFNLYWDNQTKSYTTPRR